MFKAKPNKFNVILIVLVLLGVGGFIYGTQEASNVPIEAQLKCANQAQKTLDNFQNETHGEQFTQKNHYNKKMEKCFVWIRYAPSFPGRISTEKIFDAYENRELADCFSDRVNDIKTETVCGIGNRSATVDEYIDFLNQRMESVK